MSRDGSSGGIIRLCTIECDFGRPLTHPNNAPFQRDMEAWAHISNRITILIACRRPKVLSVPMG